LFELRESAKEVALGLYHTMILSEESQKLYVLGSNKEGNLGQGNF